MHFIQNAYSFHTFLIHAYKFRNQFSRFIKQLFALPLISYQFKTELIKSLTSVSVLN